jgi:ABC-type transporter lipoprotein component MlaA
MDTLIDSAFDPYAFVRNAWLQRREYQIHNGKMPETMMPEEESGGKPPEEGEQKSPEKDAGQAVP